MSKVSFVQKLGAVGRAASQQTQRSRLGRALVSAVSATARSFVRILHQLWLEVTGLVFLLMAASGGIGAAHEYAKYRAGHAGVSRVAIAICFTLTFAWFGVSSFWRVRQKGKGGAR
ncbi:MAG: hypothetical protein ACLQLC_16555 [Candidatus Sulfotelmatobacter sp.]